jgi:hypothetical protein
VYALNTEFAVQVFLVENNRVVSNLEGTGDLFGGDAFKQQGKNFPFPFGQVLFSLNVLQFLTRLRKPQYYRNEQRRQRESHDNQRQPHFPHFPKILFFEYHHADMPAVVKLPEGDNARLLFIICHSAPYDLYALFQIIGKGYIAGVNVA